LKNIVKDAPTIGKDRRHEIGYVYRYGSGVQINYPSRAAYRSDSLDRVATHSENEISVLESIPAKGT
jgi:hypothetical protein